MRKRCDICEGKHITSADEGRCRRFGRMREEEDEGDCSIPVIDRELWRKCFREQEALAREEAEEIKQHGEYVTVRLRTIAVGERRRGVERRKIREI